MRIAVDVDGVLTNLYDYQLKYGKKYFKKQDNEINLNGDSIETMFNVSAKDAEKFWTKYIWRYCLIEPFDKNMVTLLKSLKANGDSIFIDTSRAHTTKKAV